MTNGLERDVMYKPGASFFRDGDDLMFRYQADSSSVIGPRKATEADKIAHAFEYEQHLAQSVINEPIEAPEAFSPIRPVSDEHEHVPADYEPDPIPKRRGRPPKA